MCIDENRKHACSFIVLDESHASHVSGEVENIVCVGQRLVSRLLGTEVEPAIVDVLEQLKPVRKGLEIDGTNVLMTLFPEGAHDVAPDKTASTSHDNRPVAFHESPIP